jgi:hypothetical protein
MASSAVHAVHAVLRLQAGRGQVMMVQSMAPRVAVNVPPAQRGYDVRGCF